MHYEYQTKSGVVFSIRILQAKNVRDDLDYWGYFFVVQCEGMSEHPFRVYIKKSLCTTREQAESFITTEPLTFLKKALLDKYSNGSFPMYLPDLSNEWEWNVK